MATVAGDNYWVAANVAPNKCCPRASDFQEALLIHLDQSLAAEQVGRAIWA
jgi:hypothetical protein